MNVDLLRRLNALRRARRAALVVTDTATGDARLVSEDDDLAGDPLGEELRARFASGRSGPLADAENVLVTAHLPPPRLTIIGAVHVSQALAPMARLTGLDVRIVDPRTAFASPERFPDVDLDARWPDEVFADTPLDAHTALAAVTHDPKIDDPALTAALDAGCFYVGALGSRKTHARRVERLTAAGVTGLDRIHAPIGLAIRAASPAEIAVSILAEIISVLRSRGD